MQLVVLIHRMRPVVPQARALTPTVRGCTRRDPAAPPAEDLVLPVRYPTNAFPDRRKQAPSHPDARPPSKGSPRNPNGANQASQNTTAALDHHRDYQAFFKRVGSFRLCRLAGLVR